MVAFEPSWLRFAPLTGSGVVIAAAALGIGAQFLEISGFWDSLDPEDYESLSGPSVPLVVLVPVGVLLTLLLMSVLAVGGYLVTNWAFRVTRRPPGPGGDWHLSRGLFTTRETTLDDDRVAGVIVTEPIGVRAARGARLGAIVTGLDRSDRGSSTLVPPAPRATVERTARAVLGTDAPVTGTAGGARPRRRTPPLDPRPRPGVPPRGAPRSSPSSSAPRPGCWSSSCSSPSPRCWRRTGPGPSATPWSTGTSSPARAASSAAAAPSRSVTSSAGTSGPPGSSAGSD